jgi:hypothetical protein
VLAPVSSVTSPLSGPVWFFVTVANVPPLTISRSPGFGEV